MTDYMLTLLGICFTMVTGVVIVASFGAIAFMAMLTWNLINDCFD